MADPTIRPRLCIQSKMTIDISPNEAIDRKVNDIRLILERLLFYCCALNSSFSLSPRSMALGPHAKD